MRDSDFCFWHSPAHAEEAVQAAQSPRLRRLLGHVVAGVYDVEGLTSVDQVQRILEVALLDTLGLDNSVARSPHPGLHGDGGAQGTESRAD